MFTCFVKGLELCKYNEVYGMINAAVTALRYSKETGFEYIFENDVSHLPEELVTNGWKAALNMR